MISKALALEILSQRALSYRRVILGLGVALIGVSLLPHANFDNAAIFGVKVEPDTAGSRTLVLNAMATVLIYHALCYAYYAWRDYRVWWRECRDVPERVSPRHAYFPEARMYFRMPPRKKENRHITSGEECRSWEFVSNGSQMRWEARPGEGQTIHDHYHYSITVELYRGKREKLLMFALLDVALPGFIALVAPTYWGRV